MKRFKKSSYLLLAVLLMQGVLEQPLMIYAEDNVATSNSTTDSSEQKTQQSAVADAKSTESTASTSTTTTDTSSTTSEAQSSVDQTTTSTTTENTEATKSASDKKTAQPKKKYPIVPYRTGDFQITVDGEVKSVAGEDNLYVVNAHTITFNRSGEFSLGLEYIIIDKLTNTTLTDGWVDSTSIDLTPYNNTEGILSIGIHATSIYNSLFIDTGTIHDLKMKTTSFVNVSEPTNPKTIEVGRVDDGYAGSGSSYTWQIKDAAGNVVLEGTDKQPDMTEVNKLPDGTYTVTNTAKEFYPPEFGTGSVEHTTTGTFTIDDSGKLLVHYVDEDGNELAPTDTSTGKTGTDYHTTPKTIKGYELVPTKTTGTEDGKYDKAAVAEVTYVYKKKETTVNVKYVDETGKEITPGSSQTGLYEDPYTTEEKTIPGYTFDKMDPSSAPANGKFDEEDQTVIYVYKKNPSQVITNHVDKEGKTLAPSTTQDGFYSDPYTTSPATIPGYKLVETPKNSTGTYAVDVTEVTYVYEKIKSNIIVNYVDEEGNPIPGHPAKKTPGEYGDDYTTEPAVIPGYDLVPDKTTGPAGSGTYTETDQEITYVYKKKPTVVNVEHVDKNGNPLAPASTINGLFDDPYSTAPASIPGYRLIVTPANAKGKHAVDPTQVTYVYELIPPTVNDAVEGAKEVTGEGTPGKQVEVTFPDGSTVIVDVDDTGKWTAPVPEDLVLKKGDPIIAVTVDPELGTKSTRSTEGAGTVIGYDDPISADPGDPDYASSGSTSYRRSASSYYDPSDPADPASSRVRRSSSLPKTNEKSSLMMSIAGGILIFLAGFFLLIRKRKNNTNKFF